MFRCTLCQPVEWYWYSTVHLPWGAKPAVGSGTRFLAAGGRTGAVTDTSRQRRRQRRREEPGGNSDRLSGPHPRDRSGPHRGSGEPQRRRHGHRHRDAEDRTRSASKPPHRQRKTDPARPSRRERGGPRREPDHRRRERPRRGPQPSPVSPSGQGEPDQPTPPRSQERKRPTRHDDGTGRNEREGTGHDTPHTPARKTRRDPERCAPQRTRNRMVTSEAPQRR